MPFREAQASSNVNQARFFHDCTSGWLWAANEETRLVHGYDIDHHGIGLSPSLVAELDRLAAWHDTSLNRADPDHPSPWRQEECDAFNRAVAAAFTRLSTELGRSWRLFSEVREMREDPDLDRYLQGPELFSR